MNYLRLYAGLVWVMSITGIVCGWGKHAAELRVLEPQPEEVVPGPDVFVQFEVRGFDIRPGCNSLHFALDNEPFEVQYDVSHPHRFHDVAPGTHTLRAYVANPYHEIIPQTLNVVTFAVEYHDGQNRPERHEPLLTYVLPQGEYRGIDCADIVLNFAVSGVPLSRRGYRVQYYVDGKRFILAKEESAHLRNLSPGYHTIRMELVDERGRVAPGPFNSVERVILLSPEKQLEPPMQGKQPILQSIQGPMTRGQMWVAREESELEAVPQNPEKKAKTITVREKKQVAPPAEVKSTKEPEVEDRLEETTETQKQAEPAETAKKPQDEQTSPPLSAVTEKESPAIGPRSNEPPPTTSILRAKKLSIEKALVDRHTTVTLKAATVSSTQTVITRKYDEKKTSDQPSETSLPAIELPSTKPQTKGPTTGPPVRVEYPVRDSSKSQQPSTVSTSVPATTQTSGIKIGKTNTAVVASDDHKDKEESFSYEDTEDQTLESTVSISRIIVSPTPAFR